MNSNFQVTVELEVWAWANVNSLNPPNSSLKSRTFGERSGRYRLQLGESQWRLIDNNTQSVLGEGLLANAVFKNKNVTVNGANLEMQVDGGRIDIFSPGGGLTLFSKSNKELAQKFDFLGNLELQQSPTDFLLEPQADVVIDCVFLGGASIPLKVYEKSAIYVSKYGFFIGQPDAKVWSHTFEGLHGIQISGEGLYQTGGGWVGGGFGVAGALKGAAFATVMNALTTRTNNDCYFRFVYPGIDGNFQVLSHTPRDLEIALSGVRNWLETKTRVDSSKSNQNASVNNADQLEKLWNLHQNGVITKEEFEIEKSKILGN